jgi:hypothetical protein
MYLKQLLNVSFPFHQIFGEWTDKVIETQNIKGLHDIISTKLPLSFYSSHCQCFTTNRTSKFLYTGKTDPFHNMKARFASLDPELDKVDGLMGGAGRDRDRDMQLGFLEL